MIYRGKGVRHLLRQRMEMVLLQVVKTLFQGVYSGFFQKIYSIQICHCSASMTGEKFEIAQAVAKTVINTLTRQDYVNVVCARASHWDDTGK